MLARVSKAVRDQPLLAAGVAAVALGVGFVVYKVVNPPPAFADGGAADDGAVLEEDVAVGVAEAAESLIEMGAAGLFTKAEAISLTREFLDLARSKGVQAADGSYTLDREACWAVFAHIGLKDRALADRLFDQWDVDGTGAINMKEFLQAVVLIVSGSTYDKLRMVFAIMDANGDDRVDKREMVRFLTTVSRLSKKPVPVREVIKQVDTMFAAAAPKRMGELTEDEFMALASQTRFHLGETLAAFLRDLHKRFNEGMGAAAASPSLAPAKANAGAVPPLRSPAGATGGATAAGATSPLVA